MLGQYPVPRSFSTTEGARGLSDKIGESAHRPYVRKEIMFGLGPTELLIVMAILLLLFGGAKLPQLARSLGQAQKEFKHGVSERTDDKV